jgi:protein-tyrosine phosphatase
MTEPIEHTYPGAAAVQASKAYQERHLSFYGARNFRDLGGYQTLEGKCLRWRALYRSGSLHKLTDADLQRLSDLELEWIVDFRSPKEKELEPDRLPAHLVTRLVEIPILDSSTQLSQSSRNEVVKRLKNIDPGQSLSTTNMELATRFTTEMRKFMDVLLTSHGRPVLFHCTAGKDRTGFVAAITLRMLGVPQEVVMQDYLLTNKYFYADHRRNIFLLRLLKGRQVATVVSGLVRADPAYLSTAFQTIDQNHGSFENYVHEALGLTISDIDCLKSYYLE